MRQRLTVMISLILLLSTVALGQVADIKVEAMSPDRLHQLGYTSNTTSGLKVVPKGTTVYLSAKDLAGGTITSYAWQILVRPIGSAVTLDSTNSRWTTFRPDTTGQFQIKLTITTSSGSDDTTIIITSAKHTGVGGMGGVAPVFSQGQCAACHGGAFPGLEDKVTSWKATGHATKFKRAIDGIDHGFYAQSCVPCHTTGYYDQATATTNGFDDQQRSTGWTMPTTRQPGNWDTLVARFPQLAQVATIGCENCHGPGSQHFGDKTKIDKSLDVGLCGQCHDEPWRHNRVAQWKNSGHSQMPYSSSFRQQPTSSEFMTNSLNNCIRCHDARGFINYTKGVGTDTRAITGIENLTCATCHEPHGSPNRYMLRKISVDTLANGQAIPSTFGVGGLCMNCHKSRRDGETYPVVTRISGFFSPHGNPQTDMYLGKNAHSWGQNIPGSVAHSLVSDGCVGCHMSATPDTGTVARDKIGGHSWSMHYEEGGLRYDNVSKCVDCHAGISSFNDIQAAFDYDRDGVIEPFKLELKGLKSLLAQSLPPFGVDSVAWQLIAASPDSVRLKKAYYNYKFFDYDGSGGIHNPKYAIGILQRSISILTGIEFNTEEGVPMEYALRQNYPNPFNPTTAIQFSVPTGGMVRLDIFDITGRLVTTLVDADLAAGNYTAVWKGENARGAKVSSGVYLYRLSAEGFTATKKMIMIK